MVVIPLFYLAYFSFNADMVTQKFFIYPTVHNVRIQRPSKIDYWWAGVSHVHIFVFCIFNPSYPDLDFPFLNSQGAEQRNSSLKRIKASLSYMNEKNFMRHTKLFLYFHNQRLVEKISNLHQ